MWFYYYYEVKRRRKRMDMTTTMSAKGQVVIPADIRARLGLKPGVILHVEEQDGAVRMVPQNENPIRAARGVLKWPKGSAVSYLKQVRAAENRGQEEKFKKWIDE